MSMAMGAGGSGGDDQSHRRDDSGHDDRMPPTKKRGITTGVTSERAKMGKPKELVHYYPNYDAFLQPEKDEQDDYMMFTNFLGGVVRDIIPPYTISWKEVTPAQQKRLLELMHE